MARLGMLGLPPEKFSKYPSAVGRLFNFKGSVMLRS
jgi:hypothetical protein